MIRLMSLVCFKKIKKESTNKKKEGKKMKDFP